MKTRLISSLVLTGMLVATCAFGAFQKPSAEQLKAAANDPTLLAALLVDASINQAAETTKDVIVEIVKLDLKPEERDRRVALLIRTLFQTLSEGSWREAAISLGKFIAASPTASSSPALVSAIQQAIIQNAELQNGNAFGNAYITAMQTVAGAPGGGKNVPPQPPPPPVALPYEAQRFR